MGSDRTDHLTKVAHGYLDVRHDRFQLLPEALTESVRLRGKSVEGVNQVIERLGHLCLCSLLDVVEDVNKPLVFVINAATARARITSDAAIALSQHGTVAPVTIHHRTDFASSMIDGRTVMEVNPSSRSASEITALWEYIATRLKKTDVHTILPTHSRRSFGRRIAVV